MPMVVWRKGGDIKNKTPMRMAVANKHRRKVKKHTIVWQPLCAQQSTVAVSVVVKLFLLKSLARAKNRTKYT